MTSDGLIERVIDQMLADDLAVFNGLFAVLHAREKDCPGKTWWNAEAMHPAIFRALQMDRAEDGAIYAAAAFRLHRTEDSAAILCAFPAPRILEDGDADWLRIETVIAWNPRTNTATVLGDTGPALVGRIPNDAPLHIHADPFTFLRSVAEARAQWFAMRRAVRSDWHSVHEPDLTPGLLLIGAPDKVRWPIHAMPDDITVHDLDARAFNAALLRQARIPRAVAAPQSFRKAA